MSPYDKYCGGFYTALTMAAFEGLGYHKAVWGMEETMAWGRGAGCDFLDNMFCVADLHTFCDTADHQSLRRTSGRQAVGEYAGRVGDTAARTPENCPVVDANRGGGGNRYGYLTCAVTRPGVFPGSLPGGGSWCLDAEPRRAEAEGGGAAGVSDAHAVCARVKREEGKVLVRYLGGSDLESCPAGTSISPKSSHFKDGGRIKCPKYEEVCTIAANGSGLLTQVTSGDCPGGVGEDAAPPCIAALALFALALLSAVAVPL
ncbi:surface protease GP63 [Trypanosoma conorhini]|uniref:Leishmanolysin-like peptidase n=1 Tax=Trypanosoma conorhini TaxID=83891 RepID=A0A422PJ55_9TRYP|nr:surface protease GP63 [Trypanosoma conorhini]RNF17739.1 surface protease GP63 [Trypanosoma conorhini]